MLNFPFFLVAVQKSTEEMKDFFKSLQRSFRRKKKSDPMVKASPATTAATTTIANNKVGVASLAPVIPPTAAAAEVRSRTWSSRRGSPLPVRANSVHRGEERHPGRRFTVTEDLESAWTRKEGGVAIGGVARGGVARGGAGRVPQGSIDRRYVYVRRHTYYCMVKANTLWKETEATYIVS